MAQPNERPTNGESTRQNIDHMALHKLMKRAFGSSSALRGLLSKRQLLTLFRTAKRADPRYRDFLFIGTERDITQAFGAYQLVVRALLSAMGRSLTVRSVSTDPGAVHARRAPEAPLLRDMSDLRDEVARRSAADSTLVMLGQSFGPYLSSTQKVMMPFQAAGIPVAFCFPYIPLGGTPPGDIFADAVHLIYSDPSDDKGDFLEFGVYFGRTLLSAAHTFGGPFPGMRFFGFDTYEGIKGSMDQERHLFAESRTPAFRSRFIATTARHRSRTSFTKGETTATTCGCGTEAPFPRIRHAFVRAGATRACHICDLRCTRA